MLIVRLCADNHHIIESDMQVVPSGHSYFNYEAASPSHSSKENMQHWPHDTVTLYRFKITKKSQFQAVKCFFYHTFSLGFRGMNEMKYTWPHIDAWLAARSD